MFKATLKLSFFIVALVFATSCSKKTSTPTVSETPPQTQQRQGDRPQGDRQKGEAPSYANLLEKMDANGDGRLSSTEIKGRLKEKFPTMDTNKDGFLSKEEFDNAPRPQKGQRPGPRK